MNRRSNMKQYDNIRFCAILYVTWSAPLPILAGGVPGALTDLTAVSASRSLTYSLAVPYTKENEPLELRVLIYILVSAAFLGVLVSAIRSTAAYMQRNPIEDLWLTLLKWAAAIGLAVLLWWGAWDYGWL